ncbi:MAG: non-canonical purine NTP pyrophosphatase, RdgB/HAM1 family [Candidatus Edwardsbacteria bacterium RIFOXYD12_FULL_50_11]|jgi:XTP/dITP diphosphohydrolase|uniref:dITP/XTP pyrophosphatase n=1 Tax=Candidatus Edwardsbacteria bacterium GWF2_54_11 TaxID=1817851 RepID=A0A1F5RGK0_9BACT|nr:MAG: non-canonical purine NTP pyrophosphatase, RdgB/HAM1 family [Candidatus Edwardsbacteria bacterium RifOxyC12_full_54_24]OGF07151.1 MAG: non-canonical purine NTP pyrophosphatase, RdgB/HAM1 family [Candidatus Edwardsbacteria bacterium RifOxyA12_full_54_48]OGF11102.1 MAG: non-canonical purine NTP pyrophosphatase, RdgB/HAM1 family [Candidatus Edwardsbacteria bacterium GWE2_54_12]OGF13585.1 MAG: non-canonical purine NTP pyrophosphatase, RdgB/HAM1 family [Candidatus Edwardsbacteria bacterium GWF
MDILIATRNNDKVREISEILDLPDTRFVGLDDFPDCPEAEETGRTFDDNAMIKASQAAYYSGLWALADDSGLMIDALNGQPGILSARFAGPEAGSRGNWMKVLELMKQVPSEKRTARFVCVLCLVGNNNRAFFTRGEIEGTITTKPLGSNGFGYDPIFLPAGFDKTFAQLDPPEKNRISHRSQALKKMRALINGLSSLG